jgi:hypothetical protein
MVCIICIDVLYTPHFYSLKILWSTCCLNSQNIILSQVLNILNIINKLIWCEYCNLIGWSAWSNIGYTW